MTIAKNALVVSLHVSAEKGGAHVDVEELELRAGQGIVGDRRFSLTTKAKNQLTLIEEEAVVAALAITKEDRPVWAARRNVVTRHVALNHLIGRSFFVGDALVRGVELCDPCGHLAKLTSDAFRAALVHRGGLRAEILTSGSVRLGSSIREEA